MDRGESESAFEFLVGTITSRLRETWLIKSVTLGDLRGCSARILNRTITRSYDSLGRLTGYTDG